MKAAAATGSWTVLCESERLLGRFGRGICKQKRREEKREEKMRRGSGGVHLLLAMFFFFSFALKFL